MNLLGIRQQFIKISGRMDLAETSAVDHDVDAGADFYINSGMRFMELRYITQKTKASIFEDVTAGSWFYAFQNCAAIDEVWCNDDSGRWKLKKYPYETIKKNYTGLVSATTGGPPLFYSPIFIRSMDITDYQSLGTFFNYVKSDDDGTYNGIIFTPKTEKVYNIEVIGRFFHEDLSDNTDVNYWTNIVPMTLLKAALYQLAAFYGDVKSADRWLGLIDVEGIGLEKLKVEQDSNDARVLE